MFEKVEQKCISLRNRLMENTDRIVENEKVRLAILTIQSLNAFYPLQLKEKAEKAGESFSLSPVNAPSQDLAWFCGRICVEGDSGLINATSVFIEGVNGRRVKVITLVDSQRLMHDYSWTFQEAESLRCFRDR